MPTTRGLATHLFFAMTVMALAACGKAEDSTANQASLPQGAQTAEIIGGKVVAANDPIAQTIVSIIAFYPVQDKPGELQTSLCTGSILTNNIIVTAAHCVYGLKPPFVTSSGQPQSVYVLFGSDVSYVFQKGQPPLAQMVRTIRQIKVHGSYGANQDNAKNFDDIALIAINGALPAGYHPAAQLTVPAALTNGEAVLLAGFGITDGHAAEGNPAGAGVLREVVMPIKTAAWSGLEVLIDQTGNPPRGACHGDSGGPAYVYYQNQTLLFGVTSRGVIDPINGDGATSTNTTIDYCNHYAAYTNLLDYKAWLTRKMGEMNSGIGDSQDDGGASKDPISMYGAHRKQF